jgi:hypothetical protein
MLFDYSDSLTCLSVLNARLKKTGWARRTKLCSTMASILTLKYVSKFSLDFRQLKQLGYISYQFLPPGVNFTYIL